MMKVKSNKLIIAFLMILLCVNTYSFMLLLSDGNKSANTIGKSQVIPNTSYGTTPSTLRVGQSSGPNTIDPVDCWDSNSYDVIGQVVETLFSYDLNDPELPLINQLADSYSWITNTVLNITLKQGILFHDYTPFNADAAKWNLDRLLFLTNCTGTNHNFVAYTQSLWFFPDGITPIIANVDTVGDWNIIITLNAPYSPLLHLLSFFNAAMISPSSASPTDLIDLYSGQLVGTGPFVYEYYNPDVEVKFTRWDSYWKTPAFFEEMEFVIIYDAITAHNAFLAGDLDIWYDFNDQQLAEYEEEPRITVERFTDETGKPSFVYQYLGINNNKYNQSWRKAMSYAINYSYIIKELRLGTGIKANSPISPAFGAAYNEYAIAPNYNITEARAIMQSMGFGVGFIYDYEWRDQALYNPFMTVSYQYTLGSTYREDLGIAITEWFREIGVAVIMEGLSWDEFLYYLFEDYDQLGLFQIGWAPDYPDPYNMLNPLFSNHSYANSAQVIDAMLLSMLAFALETTDETVRNNIYKDIQEYVVEKCFHIPLYHTKLNFVHLKEIQGVPYNALERFYAYPIYRATPSSFSLSSDAGVPDDDGDFTLFWTLADNADNYSVYQSSSFIESIDGNLTQIAGGITDLNLSLSNYPEGAYFFIVAAYNEFGYALSNCINVIVDIAYEHDLEVDLEVPSGIQINETYYITATVRNIGFIDETNVELFLLLDNSTVSSLLIPYLPVGESESIQYEWTPTEYKTYSFLAYAPPIIDETMIDDNMQARDVYIVDSQIFDGLYIDYYFGQMGYFYDNWSFTYTTYQNGLFYETLTTDYFPIYQWIVDPLTRIMSNMSVFGDGAHTPIWIFTDVNLGDIVPIAVDGEGDHLFEVADEFTHDLPGFGTVEVWLLEDISFPGGYAWYEKSTGILLHGLFYFYDYNYNYTFEFVDTNAQFNYVSVPGPFTLSSNADTPDGDGVFTLFWTESEDATSYSIYVSDNYITEITPDLTLIAGGVTDLQLFLEGYTNGDYYFIVVAYNNDGSTLSNCILVNVDLQLPPIIMYDTIPDESTLTYTRASQVIGSVIASSTSQIIFVGFVGGPAPGFALDTSISAYENGDIYISETTLMTTNQLEPGVHVLTLRFYTSGGLYLDKIFTVTVYRQAELNLRGEFDYLLRERIRISIIAQAFDAEDQFLLDPIETGMTVHIKIMDYDGNVKIEDVMTYYPDGFFHWNSTDTIRDLAEIFTEAIYIVQAWIEFPEDSYYTGGIDVIEFHIDPPGDEVINPWSIFIPMSLVGLVGVNIALAILLRRKRRSN